MFRFEHSGYLILLLIIPLLTVVYLITIFVRNRRMKGIGDPLLVKVLIPGLAVYRLHIKFIIFLTALAMLILALAGPQFGTKLVDVKRSNAEVIVALDVSNSMLAQDIKPGRLEKAKMDLSRLMDRLSDDRVGLLVFAGDAYTLVPVTGDILTAKILLSGVTTDMVTRGGTNIAEAIDLAVNSFSQEPSGKAILIVSDGENHEGNVKQACDKAKEKGIAVFTAGIGQPGGTRIPTSLDGINRDFLRDGEGNFVVTRLNEQMLSDIASLGGGKYFRATPQGLNVNDITAEIEKIKSGRETTSTYEEYAEQFPSLVYAAFIILLLEILIYERKTHYFSKLKLK